MAQLVNPWLQFLGTGKQTVNNQWLQKISDVYNSPQFKYAIGKANDLVAQTQDDDEEESNVEKLGKTADNTIDVLRQLQKPQQAVQYTGAATPALQSATNQTLKSIFASSPATTTTFAKSAAATSPNATTSAFNMVKNIGKSTTSSMFSSGAPNITKIGTQTAFKASKAAGTGAAKGATNAASVAGGAAGLALTAASHLLDIGLSTRSKFNDRIESYKPVDSYSALRNFKINYANRNLAKQSAGSIAADIALKTSEGALAGTMMLPGWGTLGGAVGGFFAGIGNSIAKAGTYKADLRRVANSDALAYNTGSNYFYEQGNKLNNMTNKNNLDMLRKSRGMSMAEGGQLENVFNNGGTHESNPYGGIFQGEDQVEEGEVRVGDFIYSARITADRDILAKFNCAVKRENATYADIAKQILDNFNERNDYISNKTKRILFERLAQAQEYQKVSDEAAKYGMTPEEYTQYQQQLQEQQAAQEQYQQEEAPVDKQQIMMQQPFYEDVEPQQYSDGGPLGVKNNKKSKYEHIDYTEPYKQNRDNDDILNEFLKYYNNNNKTKYDLDTIRKNLSDNKFGPITKSFMDWLNNRYQYDPEWTPEFLNTTGNTDLQNKTPIENLTRPTINDVLNDSNEEESEEPNDNWKAGLYDAARMIPTLGKLRGILEQEEPDEAYANEILSYYRPTDYNPTGRYKTYSPADQYMLMRQARAQRNALAQQYLANAGGNPAMANYMLAVNDAQYNQDLVDNYLKVKQYNDQLRNQALEYNNQLDEANEVRRANIQQANNQLWANLGLPAAAAREQERRDVEEAKYANQESFWNDLAAIARERQDRELIRRNPALMYDTWINYKNKRG